MLDKAHRKSLDIQDQNLLKQAGVKDKELVKDATPNLDVDAAHLKHDEEFCVAIQQLVIDAESESYFEHMGDYLARICELARKHTVRLDSGYFKIAMALKVAEGISLALGKCFEEVLCIAIASSNGNRPLFTVRSQFGSDHEVYSNRTKGAGDA